MLKRVPVEELRVGMFVQELCGSWMDHPFWRGRFRLKTEHDLRRVLDSGVREAWIDVSRGPDVEGGRTEEEVREEVERELEFVASMPMPLLDGTPLDPLADAAQLRDKLRPKMMTLFNDARMGQAVDTQACLPMVDEISRSVLANPGALISVARLKHRDEYTYMHSVAVCALMVALARQLGLGLEDIRQAGLAGMLHDIGKAEMPLRVLNKPGTLSEAEFAVIRTHPQCGYEMLRRGGAVGDAVLDVCLHHHEKVDGSGYPRGLSGDRLSLFAKMGAVCDVYDAITSDRPYKRGWDPGEALRKMAQWKGHFDSMVFQSFVKTVGIYPIGSLVRLQSQRLAVVTAQGSHSLLKPKVNVFFDTRTSRRVVPEALDLGGPWCQDKIIACEPPESWPFNDLDRLWGAPAAG